MEANHIICPTYRNMGEGICSRYDSKAALSIEAHFSMGACLGNQELLAELAEKLDTVFSR